MPTLPLELQGMGSCRINPCNVLVNSIGVSTWWIQPITALLSSHKRENCLAPLGQGEEGKSSLRIRPELAVSRDGQHLYVSDQNNHESQFTLARLCVCVCVCVCACIHVVMLMCGTGIYYVCMSNGVEQKPHQGEYTVCFCPSVVPV